MSLRKSIDAYCKGCAFDCQDKGTWRQQVSACTIKECELYSVRPVGDHNKKTVLPVELLKHWQIEPEDLDQRARDLIR